MNVTEELLRLTAMALNYQAATECTTARAIHIVFATMDAVKQAGDARSKR